MFRLTLIVYTGVVGCEPEGNAGDVNLNTRTLRNSQGCSLVFPSAAIVLKTDHPQLTLGTSDHRGEQGKDRVLVSMDQYQIG